MLPVGCCWAYDTGINSSILPSSSEKIYGMSVGVMGGWANVRCTGSTMPIIGLHNSKNKVGKQQ